MKPRIALLAAVSVLFAASDARAKASAKKPPPKPLPSYEEVVASYPDRAPLCQTDADVVGGNDQELSLQAPQGGNIAVNDEGVPRYQCYGTKLTVRKTVTLKGKVYRPGAKLTVDKDLYWIEVSAWATSVPGDKPAPGAPDPQKAPADVAAPPADAAKTASGLASKVLRPGTGSKHPHPWDQVQVHYTGWMTNGKTFDTSAAGGPATFSLQNVIAGWTEGLQLMVEGELRRFWIPAKLAYGDTPRQPGGPSGMLVFDVELVEIIPGKRPIEVPSDVAAPPKSATRTASGLAFLTLTKGSGKLRPHAGDRVRVHYSGWTTDGKMFDSSVTRGQPTEFPLNGVIKGWTEGVQLMVEGEKTRFWIPGKLAYGEAPAQSSDQPRRGGPPLGTLVFDIELLEIKK